jgi:hypothetical protein
MRRLIAIIIIMLVFTQFVHPKENDKFYFYGAEGKRSGKYAILSFNKTKVEVESYARWKGEMLTLLGDSIGISSDLDSAKEYSFSRDSIYEVQINGNKAFLRILKSFLGKVEFDLHKVDEVPKEVEQVRNYALMFKDRDNLLKEARSLTETDINSGILDKVMHEMRLKEMARELDHNTFKLKYVEIRPRLISKLVDLAKN